MVKHRGLILLIVLFALLAVLGFVAGFALPFWDYSTTYAPIIGTEASLDHHPAGSMLRELA